MRFEPDPNCAPSLYREFVYTKPISDPANPVGAWTLEIDLENGVLQGAATDAVSATTYLYQLTNGRLVVDKNDSEVPGAVRARLSKLMKVEKAKLTPKSKP